MDSMNEEPTSEPEQDQQVAPNGAISFNQTVDVMDGVGDVVNHNPQPPQPQQQPSRQRRQSLDNLPGISNISRKPFPKTAKQNRRYTLKASKVLIQNKSNVHRQSPGGGKGGFRDKSTNHKKALRRSMSYDTIPRVENKMIICQPLTVQRRVAAIPSNTRKNSNYKTQHRNQHLVIVCLAFISFSSMLAMAIIAPFFPTESARKGMRESINGLVFSVYAFVFMICSPLISLLIPRFGTKLTLVLGIFICGTSNILFGLLDRIQDLQTFTVFCFLVRGFEAVGGTAFSTATYTILMEEFPDNVGTAFSIVETSVGLGLSLGPAIGGFLYGIGGYGLPFYVLGAVLLANIPLCMVVIRDTKNCTTVKSPMKAYFKLLSIVKVIINSLVIIVVAQLLSFLDPTVEPHLREFGLDTHYVSLVFLILSATYTLSSPFIGWLSTMVANKFQIMAIGLFLLGIEFVFLGPARILNMETTFTQTAITMAFIGLSYSFAFIPTFETLLEISTKNGFPDDIGTYSLVSGLWSAFCSLGEILGPMFGGFLTENFGFENSSTAMGIMAFTMAVVCAVTGFFKDDPADDHSSSSSKQTKQVKPKRKSAPTATAADILTKSNQPNGNVNNNVGKSQRLKRSTSAAPVTLNKAKYYQCSEMIPLLV